MKKPTTISSIINVVLFAFFLQIKFVNAQAPASCSQISSQHITTTAATCEANGTITVPNFAQTTYVLSGGRISGEISQTSNVFSSLDPATYTLKVLCAGSNTPITINNIVVDDRHELLQLALADTMVCENQGKITATATQGYNLGTDADYKFAIWPSTAGGANRPDNQVTYSAIDADGIFTFSNLASGTYYVRVYDKCNNFYTQSVTIQPTSPNVAMGTALSWVCSSSGTPEHRLQGNLNSVTDVDSRFPTDQARQYQYKVEEIGGSSSDNCANRPVLSTIVAQKHIPDAASMLFTLPNSVANYKITTISPCGETTVMCYANDTRVYNWAIRRSIQCNAGYPAVRLTYDISSFNNYAIQYPVTLTLVGTNYNQSVTISAASQLRGVYSGVPQTAFPVTASLSDNCGAASQATVFGVGTPVTSITPIITRWCTTLGHSRWEFYLNGGYVGLGEQGTVFELLDAQGNVVASTEQIDPVSNLVYFPSVPDDGRSFRLRITPAQSTSCAQQNMTNYTNNTGQGLVMTANPTVVGNCNNGTSTWTWNASTNVSGTNTYSYRVIGTKEDGTAYSHIAANSNDFVIPPGTYVWTMEVTSGSATDGSCRNKIDGGPVTVTAMQLDPVIQKSLAATCQDANGNVLASGTATITFSGFGPFTIEQREITETNFTTVGTNVPGPTYVIENLVANKTYVIRVTDQCGKTVSQEVIVKPLSPNVFDRGALQPCLNQNYEISGIDYPGTTFEWTKVGSTAVISTARTLTFAPFTAGDAGQYKLKITFNSCLVREANVSLTGSNCNQPFPLGSIGDFVWYDLDANGIQNEGTGAGVGASGVPVSLYAYVGPATATVEERGSISNYAEIKTTVTDANGKYLFDQLETGYYRVKFGDVSGWGYTGYQTAGVDPSNMTKDNDSNAGVDGLSSAIYIDANGVGTAKDNLMIDAGLIPAGALGDYVWVDANKNGMQDAGESPKADVTVKLYVKNQSGGWTQLGSTTTDASGKYLFDELKAGTYQVEFVLPSGYSFTHMDASGIADDVDSDADRTTGKSGEIIIDPSQPLGSLLRVNPTIDAGIVLGSLPVKLASFVVKKSEVNTALINWETAEEINSSKFEVQRSSDAKTWNVIGVLDAQTNSAGLTPYRFEDINVQVGANYYRLKMIDMDGSFAYSSIQKLSGDGSAASLIIYPNPVNTELSVRSSNGAKLSRVELINTSGKVVVNKNGLSSTISTIHVKNLPTGIYVVRILMQDGSIQYRKVVIGQ